MFAASHGVKDGAGPGETSEMIDRPQSTHETFSRNEQVVVGSDRSFGMVMTGALAIVTLLNAWHVGRVWPWTGGLAALFLALAWLRPTMLNPLGRQLRVAEDRTGSALKLDYSHAFEVD